MEPKTPTHQAVQEHYGKLARETSGPFSELTALPQVSSSCCGDSAATTQNPLYPAELLSGLPADIASFTAGSGDPVSLAKLRTGETVLDLGSGAGLDCFLAARQVGPTGCVIGVDMTPDMLARARANAKRIGAANVEFREGYLESLPVEDSSVDVIISNCVINLTPDKTPVFREMMRALKPGGRIAVSDMVANRALSTADQADREKWCECTSGALQIREYAEKLAAAGFSDIHIEPNLEMVLKAIDAGQVRGPQGYTKEQLKAKAAEDLRDLENVKGVMVVPCKITAVKR